MSGSNDNSTIPKEVSAATFKRRRHPTKASVSATSTMNSAVAGYVAGVTGLVIGHPFDSAKVWLQTNTVGKNKYLQQASLGATSGPSITSISNASNSHHPWNHVSPSSSSSSSSSLHNKPASSSFPHLCTLARAGQSKTLTHPYNNHLKLYQTIRALYSGISGPLITVGLVQSLNFVIYDASRRLLHKRKYPDAATLDYIHKDSLANVSMAGFISGVSLSFITAPWIMIKTKQQITGMNFRDAYRQTLFINGKFNLSALSIGFYPHFLSNTFGRAMYYTVYEGCKRATADYKLQNGLIPPSATNTTTPVVTLQERMVSAGLAGMICWATIFPLDSLRSRLYNQDHGNRQLSTTEMMQTMYREGAFYRGFWVTVVRAGPVAAAVLPVYDLVLEQLSAR